MSDRLDDWEFEGAQELNKAAGRLEQSDPALGFAPRAAFLLARWFRSHAAQASRSRGRAIRIDDNAFELARYVNEQETR